MAILRDPKTGSMNTIHICYDCDPDTYPTGKPIVDNEKAIQLPNSTKVVCSECFEERINKSRIKVLGVNHPESQRIIRAEDREVLRHNDAAKRLNDKAGTVLMKYKQNRYTGRTVLSSTSPLRP